MSTEKKLTAVEWFAKELSKWDKNFLIAFSNEINQAKEKEKQHIIDAGETALQTDFYVNYESVEQYYNQTFKNE